MFRRFFRRPAPATLTGGPAVPRLKTYSAASGYIYHYFYRGQRPFQAHGATGIEYVFDVSGDRKIYHQASVYIASSAWREAGGRGLSATENYALSKLALFAAFDEAGSPDKLPAEIHVPATQMELLLEQLGLD